MDEQKKQKTKKILNIVVNVVVGVILVFALLITIINISSKQKGYTSVFGTAHMVVQSGSMDPDNLKRPDEYQDFMDKGRMPGFKKGDLVRVKVLKDEEKKNLEVGDVISFLQDINGDNVMEINSHRIYDKKEEENGSVTYWTRGDAASDGDYQVINTFTAEGANWYLIGKVTGKSGGFGHLINFFNSSTGFLVCIVIPSFLIVIYFAFNLTREILKYKKAGAAENKAKYEEELIAKLRAQGVQIPADIDTSAPSSENTAQDTVSEETPSNDTDNK